jgi:hypothetical protein
MRAWRGPPGVHRSVRGAWMPSKMYYGLGKIFITVLTQKLYIELLQRTRPSALARRTGTNEVVRYMEFGK